ncbi:MAG TPA: hypothetical protein VNR59_11295 [Gaiellaceae bacterium]|nr:hypothetical protein [Gaiellaceae bacterium]
MRRLLALGVAAFALLVPAYALAGPGNGGGNGRGPVPPFPQLSGNWTHVEMNVTIKRAAHTLILDRGRIVQISPSQLTVHERDGTTVVIPLSAQTIVTQGNADHSATFTTIRKGRNAMVMRIDGGAAVRVRILPAA